MIPELVYELSKSVTFNVLDVISILVSEIMVMYIVYWYYH